MKKKHPKSPSRDPIWDLIGEPYIEKIIPLLWKKAWATHRRLPLGHRFWIEPEDLFQEAYMEALRCFRLWDSKRDIKFITFVYRAVDNKMNSLLTYWGSKKRSPGIPFELDALGSDRFSNVEKLPGELPAQCDFEIPIDAVLRLLFSGG